MQSVAAALRAHGGVAGVACAACCVVEKLISVPAEGWVSGQIERSGAAGVALVAAGLPMLVVGVLGGACVRACVGHVM